MNISPKFSPPANDHTRSNLIRPSNDLLRDALERTLAAKIVSLLPPDDDAVDRIIDHVIEFHACFTSIEACRIEAANMAEVPS